jgi:hypothetical protein
MSRAARCVNLKVLESRRIVYNSGAQSSLETPDDFEARDSGSHSSDKARRAD